MTMQKIIERRVTTADGIPGKITYGFSNLGYWTVTAHFRKGRQEWGGCCHEDVLALAPDLEPLVKLHLSDAKGMPTHAEANGWYWMAGALGGAAEEFHGGNVDGCQKRSRLECLKIFAKHLRIDVIEAAAIMHGAMQKIGRFKTGQQGHPKACKRARRWVGEQIRAMRPRWACESLAAWERINAELEGVAQ